MKIAKAVVAAVGMVVTVLTAALADEVFDATETGTLVATVIEAGVTVWAVWGVRNRPS